MQNLFLCANLLDIHYEIKKPHSDIKALEEHGLIRTVFNGKPTKRKSIYGFSNKWQTWEGG